MADVEAELRWTGTGLEFEAGGRGSGSLRLDGNGRAGASPVTTLLLALGGCMGADVVEILGKMRVPLSGLRVRLDGDRAPEPPRRYTRVRLVFEAAGVPDADGAKLERAVSLSVETYCSVLHTLRPDVQVTTEIVRG